MVTARHSVPWQGNERCGRYQDLQVCYLRELELEGTHQLVANRPMLCTAIQFVQDTQAHAAGSFPRSNTICERLPAAAPTTGAACSAAGPPCRKSTTQTQHPVESGLALTAFLHNSFFPSRAGRALLVEV
eukprot:s914_g14.t1